MEDENEEEMANQTDGRQDQASPNRCCSCYSSNGIDGQPIMAAATVHCHEGERYLTSGSGADLQWAPSCQSPTGGQSISGHRTRNSGHVMQFDCSDEEQFYDDISNRANGAIATRKPPNGATLEEHERLLHVLVTRPEIAGRPRDNIIFEGDMDLKTTFETSYEALAKLRLESWKRYQEVEQHRQRQPPPSQRLPRQQAGGTQADSGKLGGVAELAKGAGPQGGKRGTAPAGCCSHCHCVSLPPGNRARECEENGLKRFSDHVSSGSPKVSSDHHQGRQSANATSSSRLAHRDGQVEAASAPGLAAAATPPAAGDTIDELELGGGRAQNEERAEADIRPYQIWKISDGPTQPGGASSPMGNLVLSGCSLNTQYGSPKASGEFANRPNEKLGQEPGAQTPRPAREVNERHGDQQVHCDSADIDPDLSSLIYYDANMNRLERFRLRKRSKYRPSTSLRSGARGLFGDQDEVRQEATREGSRRRPGVLQEAPRTDCPRRADAEVRMKSDDEGWRQPLACDSVILEARNLNNSRQPTDHLTFTAQNLPVESKRKFCNNVNMRDHIKEQNIVENNSLGRIKGKWSGTSELRLEERSGGRESRHQQVAGD